ncbi:nicotinate phosphoribosyltransferase, partial [Candidatus Woesearchaeota archaeon]|nr:nicotinate phosphoribosyltransferase [Candidatus Woesearchaeota archaeon]
MTNALLTDLYQLTMMAAYAKNDMSDDEATFDMFIRKLPEDWGYYIAAGIEDAIDEIVNLEFDESDIAYLREQEMFEESFLEELADFKFDGEVYAVKEGEVVFPNEPLLRITGKRSQVQLLETLVLNTINYQTMIASKASRVVEAADGKGVADFGLRRAQGEDAAMKGARAAYIAGCIGTSNVKAGKEYGIP